MTKREKKYHLIKKYFHRNGNEFNTDYINNLLGFGITGHECYLDENNNVKVITLTIDECLGLKNM